MTRLMRSRCAARRIHPAGLIISLYAAYMAWLVAIDRGAIGQLLDGPIGAAISIALAVAALMLWAGWWLRRRVWLTHGLLWAGSGLAAVAGTIMADTTITNPSAVFGGLVAALALMCWQLEREDPGGLGDDI